MTPRKAGSEEPPAPPPCELCEQIEMDSAFSYHTLDLHAEIAELRERYFRLENLTFSPPHSVVCARAGVHVRPCIYAEAALAPKEGR